MAAPRINATPEQIKARAKQVIALKDQSDGIVKELGTKLTQLHDFFEGDAYNEIMSGYDSMKPKFDNFSQLLDTFAQTLIADADDIVQKDLDAAQKNAAVLSQFNG